MDNFHLKKAVIILNKEKNLKFIKNCDIMKNIKFEQEEEILGTIESFEESRKKEKCINMEPKNLYESEIANGTKDKTLNGCKSSSPKQFKNGNNHSWNSDQIIGSPKCQMDRKRKISLRIDTVESLSSQNGQSNQSGSSEDSSPKQAHRDPKRTKDKLSLKSNIHKKGNSSNPLKNLKIIPIKRSDTNVQNSSHSNCKEHAQIRFPSSTVARLEGISPSSSKMQPMSPIPSTLSQKQVPKNLKIFRGLDLMCWEIDPKKIRSNEKYEIAYRNMTKKYPLIALFKCMGKKCSYATDDPLKMLNHFSIHDYDMKKQSDEIINKYKTERKTVFDSHEKNKLKLKESEELIAIYDHFLCCSYCHIREKDSKTLVHHINDIHRKDIYQCGFCFFRSCSKETSLEHWEKSHKNKVILIYECLGIEKLQLARKKVMERLLEKRKINVVPLMCKVCQVGFYPLKEFLEHCEKNHRTEHERIQVEKCLHILDQAFKANGYGMYQCLYCVHGCHKEAKMVSHLIQHPSEFGFYCMRQPEMSSDDPNFYHSIESTRIVEVHKEK
ncbi:hypothetical protein ACKWTF_008046 [Chironomus riparius]